MKPRICLAVVALLASAVFGGCIHAQQAIQTVVVSRAGVTVPGSVLEIVPQAQCAADAAENLTLAPGYGYAANPDGSFTDPVSGFTIKQSCPPSNPFYNVPVRPYGGVAPSYPQVAAPPIGVCSDIWLVIGQSNAANHGRGRYIASGMTYAYAGGGVFYQAADPFPGASQIDAGPWARLVDRMLGELPLNAACTAGINRIVVANRAQGGTTVADWAPGGSENQMLVSAINDLKAHGLTPTRILWEQGETDAHAVTNQSGAAALTSDYISNFNAMKGAIQNLGIAAPIYVSTTTICYVRSADPILGLTAQQLVQKEMGRQAVRDAQAALIAAGNGVKAGPNTDIIDAGLRVDGCHFDTVGLDQEADAWHAALTAH